MTSFNKLRLLYLACHILAGVGLFFWATWTWIFVSLGFYFFYQVFGMGIGLHRYLAHQGFDTSPVGRYFLILVGTLCSMGSPLSWAGVHRFHHGHSDTELDPHSPHQMKRWRILLGSYNADARLPTSLVKDLVCDPFLSFAHRHYFKILFLWLVLLTLINWKLLFFGYALPVSLCYWATAGGIVLNHTWGYRNHGTPDRSVNSWILSFYTLGDGWHNNHHQNPKNYRHGERWWEFDLCAHLIQVFFKKSA